VDYNAHNAMYIVGIVVPGTTMPTIFLVYYYFIIIFAYCVDYDYDFGHTLLARTPQYARVYTLRCRQYLHDPGADI